MLLSFISKGLSPAQMVVVQRGLASGLSHKKISVYADPVYTAEQMEELRLGLLDGLNNEQIRVFADPRVSADEMRRIRGIYQKAAEINGDLIKLDSILKEAEQRSKAFPGSPTSKNNSPSR